MKHKKITFCFLAVLIANSAIAAVYYVPEEYATIQSAIDACRDFDTVVIAAGRYSGSGNRNINLKGKPITVRSTDPADLQTVNSTIIDCEGKGRGFVFYMGESADSTVAGLTITNGYGLLGGAVYCYNNSSPSITNCLVTTNSAVFGGGIACANSKTRPKITNCNITANSALVGGGGLYLNGSSPRIKNCIISANVAPTGGAIYSHNAGNPVIVNCTVSGNVASNSAGAIDCYNSSDMAISNCILWGDTAPYASEVMVGALEDPTSIQISYCDIQGGEQNVELAYGSSIDWGQGNINLDPYFDNTGYLISDIQIITAGDYHLLEESPCIDAGDPDFVTGPDETDIDGNPRILGEKIDLGAYEFVTPIEAIVKIMPKTLNLESNGNWISCTIELPDGYDIADVNTDSITLNGKTIKLAWSSIEEEAQKLLVKFDRSKVQEMLNGAEDEVKLSVRGKLNDDDTEFLGTDTIRIVRGGSKK
ncbi:hypothetical protein ES703_84784 [subsurface metagenome]